jgi:hypothetical protein
MSKTTKYNKKRNIKRRNNKSKKNMRGGFAPDENLKLLNNGFQQQQIDELSAMNVSIVTIEEAIDYYNNNSNAHKIIVSIAKNLHDELPELHNIGSDSESVSQISQSDNSLDSSNPSTLNLSDLGDAIPQDVNDTHDMDMSGDNLDMSGVTDEPSMNESEISMNANDPIGGRRRRRTKKRMSNIRRNKSYRKVKGGATMYGTGYGANCSNPNFSIYNTNLTKLFPYRA